MCKYLQCCVYIHTVQDQVTLESSNCRCTQLCCHDYDCRERSTWTLVPWCFSYCDTGDTPWIQRWRLREEKLRLRYRWWARRHPRSSQRSSLKLHKNNRITRMWIVPTQRGFALTTTFLYYMRIIGYLAKLHYSFNFVMECFSQVGKLHFFWSLNKKLFNFSEEVALHISLIFARLLHKNRANFRCILFVGFRSKIRANFRCISFIRSISTDSKLFGSTAIGPSMPSAMFAFNFAIGSVFVLLKIIFKITFTLPLESTKLSRSTPFIVESDAYVATTWEECKKTWTLSIMFHEKWL